MPHILIVDDSKTIREQLTSYLQDEYTCTAAEGGEEALRILPTNAVDAVIVDLQMPGVDGIAFLRAIKSDPRYASIPVMVATTVMEIDKVNECHALGCAGFVLKPLQPDYIKAKLKVLLKARAGPSSK